MAVQTTACSPLLKVTIAGRQLDQRVSEPEADAISACFAQTEVGFVAGCWRASSRSTSASLLQESAARTSMTMSTRVARRWQPEVRIRCRLGLELVTRRIAIKVTVHCHLHVEVILASGHESHECRAALLSQPWLNSRFLTFVGGPHLRIHGSASCASDIRALRAWMSDAAGQGGQPPREPPFDGEAEMGRSTRSGSDVRVKTRAVLVRIEEPLEAALREHAAHRGLSAVGWCVT